MYSYIVKFKILIKVYKITNYFYHVIQFILNILIIIVRCFLIFPLEYKRNLSNLNQYLNTPHYD